MNTKHLFSLTTIWYLAFAAAISLVVPIIFEELNLSDVSRIGFALFGINIVYAIITGIVVGARKQPAVYLLFFPLIYLGGVRLFFESYAYYFALVYIVVALLAYGATKK
ncbi:hypothetical protein KBX31_02285 [Liquorilactobacillus satsumensis]|uniref:hypothetical protein n=1 Tax=Liquorilactobacillus satsumensis TaxID=259059 RepID=UPI0021C4BFE2|nr:hypothetical protein [Liquorilactobacillus satsumensis]MCP9312128.1 hypothetical protein [Liquorilactobacillus satsumensis]MCP9359406.1 hypothetical protein [Liquorilactobacillus satsumensis]